MALRRLDPQPLIQHIVWELLRWAVERQTDWLLSDYGHFVQHVRSQRNHPAILRPPCTMTHPLVFD